jgi:hypothetical protein
MDMRSTVMGLASSLAILAAVTFARVDGFAAAAPPETTLEVTVRYTGAGQIDDNHKLWIWLFDQPDFMNGMPIAVQSVARSGGEANFTGIPSAQVYVAANYDVNGGYQGGPPPSGSPAGAHQLNGQPVPVPPGPAAAIELRFDDSFRIP